MDFGNYVEVLESPVDEVHASSFCHVFTVYFLLSMVLFFFAVEKWIFSGNSIKQKDHPIIC